MACKRLFLPVAIAVCMMGAPISLTASPASIIKYTILGGIIGCGTGALTGGLTGLVIGAVAGAEAGLAVANDTSFAVFMIGGAAMGAGVGTIGGFYTGGYTGLLIGIPAGLLFGIIRHYQKQQAQSAAIGVQHT